MSDALGTSELGAAETEIQCRIQSELAAAIADVMDRRHGCSGTSEMLLGEVDAASGWLDEAERRWAFALTVYRKNSDVMGCIDVMRRWGQHVPGLWVEGKENG